MARLLKVRMALNDGKVKCPPLASVQEVKPLAQEGSTRKFCDGGDFVSPPLMAGAFSSQMMTSCPISKENSPPWSQISKSARGGDGSPTVPVKVIVSKGTVG